MLSLNEGDLQACLCGGNGCGISARACSYYYKVHSIDRYSGIRKKGFNGEGKNSFSVEAFRLFCSVNRGHLEDTILDSAHIVGATDGRVVRCAVEEFGIGLCLARYLLHRFDESIERLLGF